MNDVYVLDAWAILAYLQREEPASSQVRNLFHEAQKQTIRLYASMINIGEVYYRIGKRKGQLTADETLIEMHGLPFKILPARDQAILAAARLKINHSVSCADAFAAAAAVELDAILITGDPELLKLEGQFRIEKLSRR
jgi:uncharacterized protein